MTFHLLGFDAIEYQHEAEFDTRDRINRLRSYRTSVSGLYANMREDQSLEYNSRGELIKKTCLGTEPAFFTDALLPASPSIHRALGSAVPPVPPVIYSYAYDNSNNRTRSHEEGYEVAYNNMDKNNAYASILAGSKQTEFLYDAQGNATRIVTNTGTWSVVYNADNRPIEFSGEGNKQGTNIIFAYDYQGRRTKKSVYRYSSRISEKYFHYKDSLLIAEKESVTKPQIGTVIEKHAEYLWDPSEPVATRPLARTHYVPRAGNMPTGESGPRYTEYYFHDLHKNVTEIVGNDGRPIAYYYYSGPYGNAKELLAYPPHAFDYPPYEINPNDNIALQPDNPFQYSSEYYDKDLALVQYHYRDYNPRMGRWLTPDPIEEEGGTNLYAFVGNDPVNYVDYLGLKFEKIDPNLAKTAPICEVSLDEMKEVVKNNDKKLKLNPSKVLGAAIPTYPLITRTGFGNYLSYSGAPQVKLYTLNDKSLADKNKKKGYVKGDSGYRDRSDVEKHERQHYSDMIEEWNKMVDIANVVEEGWDFSNGEAKSLFLKACIDLVKAKCACKDYALDTKDAGTSPNDKERLDENLKKATENFNTNKEALRKI